MTYREAHTALRKMFPEGCAYPDLKAAAVRMAGGYVQGLKLLHELSGMGAYEIGPSSGGMWVTLTAVEGR